jgi:hypothetical protein
MKAMCIDNKIINNGTYSIDDFTIGKYYDVRDSSEDRKRYIVIDDNGRIGLVYKYKFKLVEDIRDEKLKQLGI